MMITNVISMWARKRAMKRMCNDLYEVYASTDYSNYEIGVSYYPEDRILLIPKPVMALAVVDEELRNCLAQQIDDLPVERVLVA